MMTVLSIYIDFRVTVNLGSLYWISSDDCMLTWVLDGCSPGLSINVLEMTAHLASLYWSPRVD